MNNNKLILGIFLLCICCNAKAQEWRLQSREEIDAKVRPALHKQSGNVLHFDTCRLSVGTMDEEDTPKRLDFRFRNVNQETVVITRVVTSCGCTDFKLNRYTIPVGEYGILSLIFNPRNQIGTVDAEALVYTSLSENFPVARLSIGGLVTTKDKWRHLPKTMGELRLSRKRVEFLNNRNRKAKERIICANSGRSPLKLKAALVHSCLELSTEPAVLQPGQEGNIIITFYPDKLPVAMQNGTSIQIIVDGLVGKPSERTIEVIIRNTRNEE